MTRSAALVIAALARRQHGAWTRAQALAAGFTSSMIRTRLRTGEWVRLDTGVYTHAASLPTWERGMMAAVLAEPSAVASHRSAAALHNLVGFRPVFIEITVPPRASARGQLAVVHRGVDTPATRINGIPTTTLAHTFIDLAQAVSETRLQSALAARADADARVLDAVRDRYCELAPRGGRNLRDLRTVLDRFGSGEAIEPRSSSDCFAGSCRSPVFHRSNGRHPFRAGAQVRAASTG